MPPIARACRGRSRRRESLAWISPGGTERPRQHENTSLPNRRNRKPKEVGGRNRALTHTVAHSKAVSIVHGYLIASFATTPVVCLTLAK
jgi:hypothetical protein